MDNKNMKNKANTEKTEYFTDEDYLDMAKGVSSNDCTGLIPEGADQTDSVKTYNDIYQFGIPRVDAKNIDKDSTSRKKL